MAQSIINNDKVKLTVMDYHNQLVVTGAGANGKATANGLLSYLSVQSATVWQRLVSWKEWAPTMYRASSICRFVT